MPTKILMPALSPTMTHGNLANWLKAEGDKIEPGDIIAEIDTDKATMELEAVEEGTIGKILIKEKTQNVAVGSCIAILLAEGESKDQIEDMDLSEDAITNKDSANDQQDDAQPNKQPEIIKQEIDNKRIFISPLARRIAKDANIDISQIKGTGPSGRIVRRDVENFKQNSIYPESKAQSQEGAKQSSYTKENSNIRKIIASRLQESKQSIPHFYLSIECNLDSMLKMRSQINTELSASMREEKISVNDCVIIACAKALKLHPDIRTSWGENHTTYYNNVDISVAVAIEDGLITPIIKNCDTKSLTQISREMKELVKKARDGKLLPEEFQGGSFSISNLGMYGTKNFSAIINPPQSCIMAVGAGIKKPAIGSDDKTVAISTVMEVTLSCDHRVIDGATGAKFLADFKKFIESPHLLLM